MRGPSSRSTFANELRSCRDRWVVLSVGWRRGSSPGGGTSVAMDAGRPSRTAVATAAARAAHLAIDHEPRIFADRLAGVLLGELAPDLVDAHRDPTNAVALASMRVAMTARSATARSACARPSAGGSGNTSFSVLVWIRSPHRSPLARGLCGFEVDHPATQADGNASGLPQRRSRPQARSSSSRSTSPSTRSATV